MSGASRLDREASDKAENYAHEIASSGVASDPGKEVPPGSLAAKTIDKASCPKTPAGSAQSTARDKS